MSFSIVCHLHHGGQCTYPCFLGVLSTSSLQKSFSQSHRLLSHITIIESTDSGERGMNPVAMTIINPRKEYWPSRGSNQRPSVHKSATLSIELWGLATGRRGVQVGSQNRNAYKQCMARLLKD